MGDFTVYHFMKPTDLSTSADSISFSMAATPKPQKKIKKKRGPRGPYKKRKKKKFVVRYESSMTDGNPARFHRNPYEDLLQESKRQRETGWVPATPSMAPPVSPHLESTTGWKMGIGLSLSTSRPLPELGYLPTIEPRFSFGEPMLPKLTLDMSDLESFFDGTIPSPREHIHVNSSPGAVASSNTGFLRDHPKVKQACIGNLALQIEMRRTEGRG